MFGLMLVRIGRGEGDGHILAPGCGGIIVAAGVLVVEVEIVRVIGIVVGGEVVVGGAIGREDEVFGRDGIGGVGSVPLLAEGDPGEHLIRRQVGIATDDELHRPAGIGVEEGGGQVVEAAEAGDLALGVKDDLEVAGAEGGQMREGPHPLPLPAGRGGGKEGIGGEVVVQIEGDGVLEVLEGEALGAGSTVEGMPGGFDDGALAFDGEAELLVAAGAGFLSGGLEGGGDPGANGALGDAE
jgi:hypothetical protein